MGEAIGSPSRCDQERDANQHRKQSNRPKIVYAHHYVLASYRETVLCRLHFDSAIFINLPVWSFEDSVILGLMINTLIIAGAPVLPAAV